MNEIKIEKGIPIPAINGRSTGLMAAMRKMEIGDSIVVSRKQQQGVGSMKRGLGTGVSLITRKISEDEIRVWRVK